jgi:cytochrome c5
MMLIAPVAGVAFAPCNVQAEGNESKLSLQSVRLELPSGDRMFPDGPGADVANGNCLACHSVGMVLYQPALSKAQWHSEVEKMRTAYKAPIDPKDVDAIVDYLVSIRGTK